MGKNKKEHRKKVAKRNEKIKNSLRAFEKAKNEYMDFLKNKAAEEEKIRKDINPGITDTEGPSLYQGPKI